GRGGGSGAGGARRGGGGGALGGAVRPTGPRGGWGGGAPRRPEPLQEVPAATWLDPDGLASAAIDLERPIEQARFLTTVVAPEVREPLVRSALRTAVVGACLLGASLLWAQTAPPPFDMVSTIVPLHDPAAAP